MLVFVKVGDLMRGLWIAVVFVAGPVLGQDQIRNGNFQSGIDGWWTSSNLTLELRDGQACVDVPGGTTNPWDAIVGQSDVSLVEGEGYNFSVSASGDPSGLVRALVQSNEEPWTTYATVNALAITDVIENMEEFVAPIDIPNAQVVMHVGGESEPWTFCLNSVALTSGINLTTYAPNTGSVVRVN